MPTLPRALFASLLSCAAALAAPALAAPPPRDEAKVPVTQTARSGPWSDKATWQSGVVPGAGACVLIREGHRVEYDVKSDRVVRGISVSGTLSFATDRDTRLDVGLIKIQAGDEYTEQGFDCEAHVETPDPAKPRPALEVGTADRPVGAKSTAVIRLHYIDGMDKDSCPAIVCCGGRMEFHGAPLSRTWVKLGADAKAGQKTVTLGASVTGWRVGDRVIVTATKRDGNSAGTRRPGKSNRKVFTEERTVAALDGSALTLDKPLAFAHAGEGEFRGEVANLSRNVVVESADPSGVRGHTMYHKHSAGSISYAEFRHLGKEGVLGRYALHFHLARDTMRGSYVKGASIHDSHNRWLTIHGTDYLVVRDCVGYGSVGHGFFMEDGTEVYNVLDRNLAVQSYRGKRLPKQVLPFDQNEGTGFWWANSHNTFTRNVSCENDLYGYRFEATRGSSFDTKLRVRQPDGSQQSTDIRTLPFVRFDDNESHCDGLYGFNLGEGVDRVGPDARHPFVIRRMKIWEIHYAFRVQSPSVLVEGMTINRSTYGVYHPNYDNHVYRDLRINGDGAEPFNRGHDDLATQHGALTVDGLTFTGTNGYPNSVPLIQISANNPTGKAVSHFRNVKVIRTDAKNRRPVVDVGGGAEVDPDTPTGVAVFLHDHFGPGKHAKVLATNAKDFAADGLKYAKDEPLTGGKSRITTVQNVAFPKLLDPVDDLPPATVVTYVRRLGGGRVLVRGVASDNGTVKRVTVNGRPAKSTAGGFAEWEIVLDSAAGEIRAHAEDDAGNVEKTPHIIVIP